MKNGDDSRYDRDAGGLLPPTIFTKCSNPGAAIDKKYMLISKSFDELFPD